MPCIAMLGALVNIGNPTELVTMCSGKTLHLEWGDYFGPAVETRTGLRCLTNREFRDANIDAWIVGHGGKSCREDEGPLLPKSRKRTLMVDPSKPRIVHKASVIDRIGNSSALCFAMPHAIDLSHQGVTLYNDAAVTCQQCRALMGTR